MSNRRGIYTFFLLILLNFPFFTHPTNNLSIIEQIDVDEMVDVPLAQAIQTISENVDWSKAVYAGLFFGEKTRADMETLIDSYAASGDWLNVLRWSVICRKLGIEREDAIKAALDNLQMIGPLPWTTKYSGVDYFCVEEKYALFCYYYADKYQYRLDKWNKTNGYDFFKTAMYNNGRPALFINANGGTWTISYGPRYYDESASTVQCFLIFYELGIAEALNDALYWWNWINNNLWYQNTHYKYALNWVDYECEAGFFAKIAANLKYYENDLGNWSRVLFDLQNRFLIDGWNSKQWFSGSENKTTYVVVHHYPSNSQRRLQNTIGAWTTLLALYTTLENESRLTMQEMLQGYIDLAPAWKLLESPEANLYDSVSGKFRWLSSIAVSDDATAYALTLMLFLGIVPKTTTIAFPLEEYSYEYIFDIDPELYNLNLSAATLRVSVINGGQLEFIYGTVPVLCEFPSSGTYEITFSSDWNNILNITKLQDLPSNRKFLTLKHDITIMDISAFPYNPSVNESVTIHAAITNNGNFTETFKVTMSCTFKNSEVYNETKEATLNPTNVITLNFTWTPEQEGSYRITVYIHNLLEDSNPQDNMKNLIIYVYAIEMKGPYYTWFGIEYWIVQFMNHPIRLISNYY